MTEKKFVDNKFDVWSFGRDPARIDLMTEVKGLDFDDAFNKAQHYIEGNVSFRFLHLNSLIKAKESSGRHRDIDDIEQLSKK